MTPDDADNADAIRYSDVAAPIIISIIGHRNVHERFEEKLKTKLVRFFHELFTTYRNTSFVFQSSLTPGSDQIAFDAFLDAQSDDGIAERCRTLCVIPCEDEERFLYESFHQNNRRYDESGHHDRRRRCDDIVHLPNYRNDDDDENWYSDQLRAYGAYLITSSHILIAAWDGEGMPSSAPSSGRGGTADIVRMAHDGIDSELKRFANMESFETDESDDSMDTVLKSEELCLVYHVRTPRSDTDYVDDDCPPDEQLEDGSEGCTSEEERLHERYGICGYYIPTFAYHLTGIRHHGIRGEKPVRAMSGDNVYGMSFFKECPSYYKDVFEKMDDLNEALRRLCESDQKKIIEARGYLNNPDPYGKYRRIIDEFNSRKDESKTLDENCGEFLDHLKSERGSTLFNLMLSTVSYPIRSHLDRKGYVKTRLKAYDENTIRIREFERIVSNPEYERILNGYGESEGKTTLEAMDDLSREFPGPSESAPLTANRYACADVISQKDRDRNQMEIIWYIVLVAMADFFLALYLIPNETTVFIVAYLFFLVAQIVVLRYHGHRKTQSKYLEYRVLSESMRVYYYWRCTGINHRCDDRFFGLLRIDMSWIRFVVKSWMGPVTGDKRIIPEAEMPVRYAAANCHWITDQQMYHMYKSIENSRKRFWGLFYAAVFYSLSIATTAITMCLEFFQSDALSMELFAFSDGYRVVELLFGATAHVYLSGLLKIIVALLNLLFVAVVTRNRLIIYGGDAKEILSKKRIFEIAFDSMMNSYSRGGFRTNPPDDLLINLGRESISETHDWALSHSKKDIQSPIDKGDI